jgi:GMP synthase-like glutamine amidotransferase
VGVLPVTLTADGAADPLFAGLPASFPTLQWHGDTFDLPEGATLLASSPAFPNQAFRYGRAAYGIQFHMEVLPEMAREWALVPEYAGYADRVLGEGGMGRLLADFDGAEAGMRATGRAMFERWAELAVPVAG